MQLQNHSGVENRNGTFDLVRSVAILCVVLNHSAEWVYEMWDTAGIVTAVHPVSRAFAFTTFTVGRLGVPLFFFLTACLMLQRNYEPGSYWFFFKKKVIPLVLTWEIWIVLFYLFQIVFFDRSFRATDLGKMLLLVEYVGIAHEWYMPVIIGLYCFIPFLAVVLQRFSKEDLLIPLGMTYVAFFLPGALGRWTSHSASTLLDLSFSGGVYGFYLILGYVFYNRVHRNGGWQKYFLTFLVLLAGYVAIQMLACRKGIWTAPWYSHPLLPVVALALFATLLKLGEVSTWKGWTTISELSFGIYLVHKPVQMLIAKYVTLSCALPLRVVLIATASFAVSLVLIWMISKLPMPVRKLLILKK